MKIRLEDSGLWVEDSLISSSVSTHDCTSEYTHLSSPVIRVDAVLDELGDDNGISMYDRLSLLSKAYGYGKTPQRHELVGKSSQSAGWKSVFDLKALDRRQGGSENYVRVSIHGRGEQS